jgi:hypothetical protein
LHNKSIVELAKQTGNMKAAFSLVALAASALAANVPRWGKGGETTTIVTYETTTVCPVTSTYTEKGTTYEVTKLTTSTITVTSCRAETAADGGVPQSRSRVPQ